MYSQYQIVSLGQASYMYTCTLAYTINSNRTCFKRKNWILSKMEYLQPLRISALAVFRRTPLIVLYLAVETPIQQLSLKLILTLQIKHLLIKCFTPFQDESKLLHLYCCKLILLVQQNWKHY